jgi:predicted alpha-1,2-mannosidase
VILPTSPPRRLWFLALVALVAAMVIPPSGTAGAQTPTISDPTAFVNPMIGTTGGGNVFPGASLPFGMVQWSPVETAGDQDASVGDSAEYTYPTTKLRGFSLTHVSSGGCPDMAGDIPVMPYPERVTSSPSADVTDAIYSSTFAHDDEVAQPGYYGVTLDSGVGVQLSVTKRTGSGRFTFPTNQPANLLFRVSNSAVGSTNAKVTIDPSARTVSGWVVSGGSCGSAADPTDQRAYYKLYFVAQFDRSFAGNGTWHNSTLHPGASTASGGEGFDHRAGKGSGAYVSFDPSPNPVVDMRVGISYVSASNALANLSAENPPSKSFASVKAGAHQAWQNELNRVQIGGGTAPQQTVFYTALYHALLQPTLASDVNGQYEGADTGKGRPGPIETIGPHQGAEYQTFSGWDQYRGQVQLVTLVNPAVGSDFAQSLLNQATQRDGEWDRWLDRNGKISIMEGDPSPTAVAGIYAFGGTHFDLQAAYQSLLKAATQPTANDLSGVGCPVTCVGQRPELNQYLARHYVPATNCKCWGSTGETLEDVNADFSVAELARDVGDNSTFRQFLQRSSYWKNVFNPKATGGGFTGYMQQRNANGTWTPDFNYAAWAGFAEGSSAQYTWMVYPDVAGLAKLLGGDAATVNRLDAFFHSDGAWAVSGGNTALFDPTDEPDIQTPWMFDYLGAPADTEATVRKIIATNWTDTTGGIPGNDDLGTMSAWNVWASLGMYPYVPSQASLVLASPLFPHIVIHRGNGVTMTIDAPGAGANTMYVQHLAINGQTSTRPWLPSSFVNRGGNLQYTLAATPDATWGSAPGDAPPSLSTPPSITVTPPANGPGTTVTVTASSAMTGLRGPPSCILDGSTPLLLRPVTGGHSWSATVSQPGRHTVACTVSDNNGTVSHASITVTPSHH